MRAVVLRVVSFVCSPFVCTLITLKQTLADSTTHHNTILRTRRLAPPRRRTPTRTTKPYQRLASLSPSPPPPTMDPAVIQALVQQAAAAEARLAQIEGKIQGRTILNTPRDPGWPTHTHPASRAHEPLPHTITHCLYVRCFGLTQPTTNNAHHILVLQLAAACRQPPCQTYTNCAHCWWRLRQRHSSYEQSVMR